MIFTLLLVGARGEIPSRVVFLPTAEGKASISSDLVFLDEQGLAVAICAVGVDPRQGRAEGRELVLVAHDPLSRITLLRVPLQPGESTEPVELGSTLKMQEGAALFTSLEGGVPESRFVGRESTYKGKPLPLELLRVHHPVGTTVTTGAPLYDTAGRLLGISYRKAEEIGNGTFVFPAEAIAHIRNSTRKNEIVERSWFGVELLATDPAAVVQAILVDSPATKAGLQKGDILLKIGDRKVRNYNEAVNAFFYLVEGRETAVSVLRGTEKLDFQVTPELVPPPVPAATPDKPVETATGTGTGSNGQP